MLTKHFLMSQILLFPEVNSVFALCTFVINLTFYALIKLYYFESTLYLNMQFNNITS